MPIDRRDLLKSAALLPALASVGFAAQPPQHAISFGCSPQERLNQGPFDIDQDQGWQTILFTTSSEKPLRNPGYGLVGYSWEESGPSLAARAGRETLEQHVEKISSLPFVDVLYIRCDWRNVQSPSADYSGQLPVGPNREYRESARATNIIVPCAATAMYRRAYDLFDRIQRAHFQSEGRLH